MLEEGTAVGHLNNLLKQHGAAIVGSSPKDPFLPNAVLMLRLPTSNALDLFNLTQTLEQDGVVAAAAPDILMVFDVITDDANGAKVPTQIPGFSLNWTWDDPTSLGGGKWGLKTARVPQMWNFNASIKKKNTPPIVTGVLDGGFPNHEDLVFSARLGPANGPNPGHGLRVAGTIGAWYDNKKGIDGVNPFAELVGYTHGVVPTDVLHAANPLAPVAGAQAHRFIEDTRELLRQRSDVKIVNMSLGLGWGGNSILAPLRLQRADYVTTQYGKTFAQIAKNAPGTLFVCAAGNDYGNVPAEINSPMNAAALKLGAPNIIVVEAHYPSGARCDFSNVGGHVSAPGFAIVSAYSTNAAIANTYEELSGTSQATPFVSGLVGYLLALDSNLKPAELIKLLRGNGLNVDAFTSAMLIDNLPSRNNKDVLKKLLDVGDDSPDGCQRVDIPPPILQVDRFFQKVTIGSINTDEDLNKDGGPGDGQINMGDFRRWRDWLLFGQGGHALNGGNHGKLNANYDARTNAAEEITLWPRGDFNGDGKMDTNSKAVVAGALLDQSLTDLEVLMKSGLWQDQFYTDVNQLPGLIDSVDITVSAENFYRKTGYGTSGEVAIYDAATDLPVSDGTGPIGKPFLFTTFDLQHIFTVPTGHRYYVSSSPIPIGGGTCLNLITGRS